MTLPLWKSAAIAMVAWGILSGFIRDASAAPGDLLFKLTAPDPQPGASFGRDITIVDGDLLVGAMTTDLDLGIDATGRAYLFDGQTGQLKQTFDNPEPMPVDFFGSTLAGGDERVFISARGAPTRVYAFATKTGEHLHTIHQPTQFHNTFGAAIGYGNGSVAVSSPGFSIPFGLQGIGQAELFDGATGQLEHALPNLEPKAGDNIGSSLAIAADRVFVGAMLDDLPGDNHPDGDNAGRVWVFDRSTGDTLFTLENPNPQKIPPNFFSDRFGGNVAANEDFVVVSARQEDANGVDDSGAAYVFDIKTGALVHTLLSPLLEENAFFGHSVAISAGGQILIGANSATVNGVSGRGRAFLFDAFTGNLLLDIANPEPNRFAGFGYSVALTDERLFVGTPTGAETVFVFQSIPEPSTWASALVLIVLLIVVGGMKKFNKRIRCNFDRPR
jgi:hypothetical protein